MRKVLFILLSLLVYTNSNAQKKNINKKQNKMEIPNITKDNLEIPKLNDLIKQENERILEKTKDSSRMISDTIKNYEFDQNGYFSVYKEGKLIWLSKITEDNVQTPVPRKKRFNPEGVIEFKQSIHTWVYFYPNGSVHIIEQYNESSTGSYPAGNWYVYDESGKLLQHIDHEKHFRMSYYDVAQIADSYDYPQITISRGFAYGPSWSIDLAGYPEERPNREKLIDIDDKTGKILLELDSQEEINNRRALNLKKYNENKENDLYKLFKN